MSYYGIILLSMNEWVIGLMLFWGFVFLIQSIKKGVPDRGITKEGLKRLEIEEAEEKERQRYEDDYYESLACATEEEVTEWLHEPDQTKFESAVNWEEESKKEKEKHTQLYISFHDIWTPMQFEVLNHNKKIKMFYQDGSLWSRYEENGFVYECRSIRYNLFIWCKINPVTKDYLDFAADDGTKIPKRFWEVRMESLENN